MTKIFQISEVKNNDFVTKMEKFTNKAKKLGLKFGYTLESTTESYYTLDNSQKVYYSVYNYSVYGDSPTINGYSFLAKIEPFELGVNLVHSHNNDYDFTSYRTADLICEHCKVNRQRNFYYLIQSESDNSVKMVGHNCLANYINLPDSESIAQFYSDFIVSSESFSCDEKEEYAPSSNNFYSIKISDFLAFAKVIVNKSGYVSTKNESLTNPSTKVLAINEYFYNGSDKIKITEENIIEVESILAVVKNELTNRNNLSEYEFNILKLIESGKMKISHAGYIVSIIPLYNRIIVTSKEETNEKTQSQFVGIVGDKITNINAIVTFYNRYDTQYGYTHLYKFNNNNNVITYFSSKDLFLNVNDNVIITKATIKAHDTYNGVNQTVITRGKIDIVQ